MRKLTGWLLHWANSDPPAFRKDEFYALKARLLRRLGTHVQDREQHIVKPCWGERSYDSEMEYDYKGCGPHCRRCGGTGKYDEFWVTLEEWDLAGYHFHLPVGGKRRLPRVANGEWIEGFISHPRNPQRCREALLWLCLLYDPVQFARRLASGYNCTCRWWPLLNLQRAVTKLVMGANAVRQAFRRWGWDDCWDCGVEFWRWPWNKRLVCGKCHRAGKDGMPF